MDLGDLTPSPGLHRLQAPMYTDIHPGTAQSMQSKSLKKKGKRRRNSQTLKRDQMLADWHDFLKIKLSFTLRLCGDKGEGETQPKQARRGTAGSSLCSQQEDQC